MICPECKQEMNDKINTCANCGFDLALYRKAYEKIYSKKMHELIESEKSKNQAQTTYQSKEVQTQSIHKVRCPYCNSENLTRITSLDKAVNIALFSILGNKRKYQWHCNNCKTNW